MAYLKSFIFTITLIFAVSYGWSVSAVKFHGQLTVTGGEVVNQNGHPPELRGMSLFWSQWMGKFWTKDVVDWLVKDWKITLIRAAVGIESYGKSAGYLKAPDKHKGMLKTVIDAAIANGIYVIIDWHSHNATKQTQQAKAFFSEMAQTYGKTPNVLFEIFNEPDNESWNEIKNYAIDVSKEIRKHSENLIIVGTPQWDQRVDQAAESPITDISNIAYAFHFYSSDKWHQENLRKHANTALSKKLPLFVTEWGVSEANGSGNFDKGKTETWMKWMSDNKLSWANWSIADKNETSAALRKNASVKGDWKDGDISASGAYLRDNLRRLNKDFKLDPSSANRFNHQIGRYPDFVLHDRVLYINNAKPSGYEIYLPDGRMLFNAAKGRTPVSKVKLYGWPVGVYILRHENTVWPFALKN